MGEFLRDLSDGIANVGIFLDDHPWVGPVVLLFVLAVIL